MVKIKKKVLNVNGNKMLFWKYVKRSKEEAPRRVNSIKTKSSKIIWKETQVRKSWKEHFRY